MVKILLVEDNEMNIDIVKRRLEMEEFEVLVAKDGEVAIEMAKNHLPDLIIMDMGLPKIDGWQAAGHIKGIDETCNIPIIALTAHAMSGDREKCLAAGCTAHATKPLDRRQLIETIRNQISTPA